MADYSSCSPVTVPSHGGTLRDSQDSCLTLGQDTPGGRVMMWSCASHGSQWPCRPGKLGWFCADMKTKSALLFLYRTASDGAGCALPAFAEQMQGLHFLLTFREC